MKIILRDGTKETDITKVLQDFIFAARMYRANIPASPDVMPQEFMQDKYDEEWKKLWGICYPVLNQSDNLPSTDI